MYLKDKEYYSTMTIMYIKTSMKDRVTNIEYDTMKFGYLGSSCASVIRLQVDDTVFSFVNCLLDSGSKNILSRAGNLTRIHEDFF